MKRFLTTKGLIGLTLVTVIALIGILAPVFIPADAATAMDMTARLSPPTWKSGKAASGVTRI